ncbi:hypothetical protein EK21DRAFT_85872 [Setomelanomma holmii]|uniref:RING-type domain-containing protein n=1 Tax=Setomelanomma holmii TaxID=210430 RepID=A0A9P4HGL0_9PLEO|nr:hypothetical protein EK21DRAFT_85872 [Setomelanomma holmii]
MSTLAPDRASMHSVDNECALCYEDLGQEHPPVPLDNCQHVFGRQCLDAWMASDNAQRNKCPTCRAVLFNLGARHHNDNLPLGPLDGAFDDPDLDNNNLHQPVHPYRNFDTEARNLYRWFIMDQENVSSFYRKLWRRAVRTLTPQYTASGHRITPELETAARIVLIELLNHIGYEPAHEDEDVYELLLRSLHDDREAILLCRRFMQLVMVMVMLSTFYPMSVEVVLGCFDLLPDLDGHLNFDLINTAIAHPSGPNAAILKIVTMLLVDHSIGYVANNLGAQWYVGIRASNLFYNKALVVKETMAGKSRDHKEAFKQMTATNAEIVRLWSEATVEEQPRARGNFCARLLGMFWRANPPREPRRTLTRPQPAFQNRAASDRTSRLMGPAGRVGSRRSGARASGARVSQHNYSSASLLVSSEGRVRMEQHTHMARW